MTTLGDRVKKGIRLFLVLAVVTMILLLMFTARRETLEALRKVNVFYLIFAFILWLIYIFMEAVRLSLFIHGITGRWGSISMGLNVMLTGAFLSAVTPTGMGGFPVQLYIMEKEGISFGRGTLVLLLRWIFCAILIISMLPFLLPIFSKQSGGMYMKVFLRYSMVIYIILIVFITFILVRPKVIKRFLYRISLRHGRRTKVTKLIYKGFREIEEMREDFWSFSLKKRWHSIASYFLTFLTYLPFFSIAPILLKGLGVDVAYVQAVFLPLVVSLFTFFAPTPGATGLYEGGFAILFAPFVVKHLLGVFTILWRFFTYYLAAILGGLVTLKVLKLGEREIEE
jgi:uncharacterized protein (TIRG00374 family)